MTNHQRLNEIAYWLETNVSATYMPTQQDAFRELEALDRIDAAILRLRRILKARDPRDPSRCPDRKP